MIFAAVLRAGALRRLAVALAAGCLAICGVSCGGVGESKTFEREYSPGINAVHRSYSEGSNRWTGATCVFNLSPGEYTTRDGYLVWCCRMNSDPPDIVFDVRVSDITKAVTVAGTCDGLVKYGKRMVIGFSRCQLR